MNSLGFLEGSIDIGTNVVAVDPKYFRSTEVDLKLMTKKDVYLQDSGYKTMNYYE